jgi:hypothetical protein
MRIVRLTLAYPLGRIAGKADAELICDALWTHSGPGDEIEHITTTALCDGIDIVIFLNSSADAPERWVAALASSIAKSFGMYVKPKTRRSNNESSEI